MSSQVKLTLSLAYTSGPFIEHDVVVSSTNEIDRITSDVKEYLQHRRLPSYIQLLPYNEDPNSEMLNTELVISLEGLRSYHVAAQVIRAKKPI